MPPAFASSARPRPISDPFLSVARAQERLPRDYPTLFHSTPEQVPDGYFSTFLAICCCATPKILSWEVLVDRAACQAAQAELYGLAKSIAPAKPFGFHLMQNMTFSPFYRAEEDYTKRPQLCGLLQDRHLQQQQPSGFAHGGLPELAQPEASSATPSL